jgi:orotidine-5'-phosphate decarboxylase
VTTVSTVAFADRLAARVAERRSQLVLGLDPDPARLWPASAASAEAEGDAVALHCRALIAAAGSACVAIKPQLACFERLGAVGRAALDAVVEAAHAAGLLVLADGKRGDVPVTARAYAEALTGKPPKGLGADALTANPLLGRDALEPLLETGAGVFLLVRTSNPGAADVQDLRLDDGRALWEALAALADDLGSGRIGAESGLSNVGAVVGATAPEHLARARELMPRTVFLLPGVGAQGGRIEDLAAAWAPGRAAGLVTASRSIARAHERADAPDDPATAAASAAERLRDTAWAASG